MKTALLTLMVAVSLILILIDPSSAQGDCSGEGCETSTKDVPHIIPYTYQVNIPGRELLKERLNPRVVQPGKEPLKKIETRSQESRVVNGQTANKDEWPWQASLQLSEFLGTFHHICGGAIIRDKWVLTAAHCVNRQQRQKLRIEAGITKVSQDGQVSNISRVIMHPNYGPNSAGIPNDIALLELSTPLDFGADVQTVTLPTDKYQNFLDNSDCWITGWGKIAGDHISGSDVLYEAQMPSISNSECSSSWTTVSGAAIYEHHICLYQQSVSACSGDSGGPYVCKVDGKYVLAGMMSWGMSTCSGNFPSVCTRVSSFIDWIANYA